MTDFDTMEETAHVTEEQIIDIRGSGAFHKTIQSDSGNNTIQSDSSQVNLNWLLLSEEFFLH
jgi:hypothetical protein